MVEGERPKELELLLKEVEVEKAGSPSGSGRNSPAIGGSSDKKTPAEKRFEEIQKKRVRTSRIILQSVVPVLLMSLQLAAKVAKLANKTHKDRVHEFNSKLEALSEHHDIPKVSHIRIMRSRT